MRKIYLFGLSLLVLLSWVGMAWAGESGATLLPNHVDVGLNFRGSELTVSGTAPAGSDIFIKVTSPNDSILELNKKGKVGLFWMNVETSNVTDFPKLYQVLASSKIDKLPESLQKELGLDKNLSTIYSEAKVEKHGQSGSIELSGESSKQYISALIDIYKKSNLYAINENAIKVNDGKFESLIKLPPNLPQEKCNVTIYAIKDGKVISTQNLPLSVEGVGLVKLLNELAIYDGPTYGFISVLIALAFGIGIAFVFIYWDYRKNPNMTKEQLLSSDMSH